MSTLSLTLQSTAELKMGMTKPNPPNLHLQRPFAAEEEDAQIRWLKVASAIEATTLLLLLCIAVPLKHLGNWPLGVRVMGPVHGLAFVAYIWMALQVAIGARWRRVDVARLILLAVIPFGGYINAALLSRALHNRSIGHDR
ncbi:DUF3817 domain-containing protein [Stenotrophomonas lactitubi]|uniref:DUF3817 domain-containing protein n=1 Tax=Stenotrophomonas lactitubi TaxID=2045214 RepID=UPI00333E2516